MSIWDSMFRNDCPCNRTNCKFVSIYKDEPHWIDFYPSYHLTIIK